MILTAPLSSNVHMAPYHYCSGFSKYWYEHHLTLRGFEIKEIIANGDWYALLKQEITRLGGLERQMATGPGRSHTPMRFSGCSISSSAALKKPKIWPALGGIA